MDLMPGGSLWEHICYGGPISEKFARFVFCQLLDGLEYIHKVGYAHRDIKPQNLLLDQDFNLKIADFGVSTLHTGSNETGLLRERVGTPAYMLPEMFKKLEYSGI